jgi:hypothetical protein
LLQDRVRLFVLSSSPAKVTSVVRSVPIVDPIRKIG